MVIVSLPVYLLIFTFCLLSFFFFFLVSDGITCIFPLVFHNLLFCDRYFFFRDLFAV